MPQMLIQVDPKMDKMIKEEAAEHSLNSKSDLVVLLLKKYFDEKEKGVEQNDRYGIPRNV